jgi:hypothetical protein
MGKGNHGYYCLSVMREIATWQCNTGTYISVPGKINDSTDTIMATVTQGVSYSVSEKTLCNTGTYNSGVPGNVHHSTGTV